MTAAAFASSPTYGSSVVLGPTQAAVYRFVIAMTEGGRRPYLTLAQIASSVDRPVSSVHDALGRLRALGLIGCAVRMGRTGGHRLWRVAGRVSGTLDRARHSRTIARVLRRWPIRAQSQGRQARLAETAPLDDRTAQDPPADPHPPGAGRRGPTFGDRMRRAGFVPWWQEVERGTDDDRGRVTDRPDGSDDVLGLALAPRET